MEIKEKNLKQFFGFVVSLIGVVFVFLGIVRPIPYLIWNISLTSLIGLIFFIFGLIFYTLNIPGTTK